MSNRRVIEDTGMKHATKKAVGWRLCLIATVAVLSLGNVARAERPRRFQRVLQWIPFVGEKADSPDHITSPAAPGGSPATPYSSDGLPSWGETAVSVTRTDRASAAWLDQSTTALPAADSAAARAQAAMGKTVPRDITIRDVPAANVAVMPPLATLPSASERPVAIPSSPRSGPVTASDSLTKSAAEAKPRPVTHSSNYASVDSSPSTADAPQPEASSTLADRLARLQPISSPPNPQDKPIVAPKSGHPDGPVTSPHESLEVVRTLPQPPPAAPSAKLTRTLPSPTNSPVTPPTSPVAYDPVVEYRRLQQAQVAAEACLARGHQLLGSDPTAASNEFLRCVATIAESRDRVQGMTLRSESLRNGIAGMIERDLLEGAIPDGPAVVASIVREFQTPVGIALQKKEKTEREVLATYPDFIKQSFVVAIGESSTASQALAGLAKIHSDRWQSKAGLEIDQQRMLILLEAAIAVDEGNWQAANELGIAKAEAGLLSEARGVRKKRLHACDSRGLEQSGAGLPAARRPGDGKVVSTASRQYGCRARPG